MAISKGSTAAVIGSGVGGLAAAIRLQAQGIQTTLFEKMERPGGRGHSFELDGFRFDAGPTVITAPGCIEDLYTLCGKRMEDYVKIRSLTPFYRLRWEDGGVFDYDADPKSLKQQMDDFGPGEWEGYQRFLAYAEEVYEQGYVDLSHVSFSSFWSMMKVAPDLLRLRATTPIYQTVSKFVRSERLRQILSFNTLLIGGNPFDVSSIYSLIHPLEKKFGVHSAEGGMGSLVDGLWRLYQDIGGKVRLGAEVDRINVEGGAVSGLALANGETYKVNTVVSNCDMIETYGRLLKHLPDAKRLANRWGKKHFSMSLFVYYFGTDKMFPGLSHHNILFGHRYRELLKDIFHRGVIPDDFSLYLYAPSVNDPTMAPEGGGSFYVLSPVAHMGKNNVDWDQFGPVYRDKIINYLEKHYMPGLRSSIKVDKMFTPKDFESSYNSHLGSAFSLEPRLTQSAYFRLQNRDKDFEGLYFVGASTHPGAGLPGVIDSAKATTDLIVAPEGQSRPFWKDSLTQAPVLT
ncbi:MAG: phytoene dehydrogenase [Zetaproteobacteria bacterium]|nr:phytoene dehydrogenase [Pseudobdellovibrionaceae bacterium]